MSRSNKCQSQGLAGDKSSCLVPEAQAQRQTPGAFCFISTTGKTGQPQDRDWRLLERMGQIRRSASAKLVSEIRTERSIHLSPCALPFWYFGFVLLSCSLREVGSGTDSLYFVLCTSESSQFGGFLRSVKKTEGTGIKCHWGIWGKLCYALPWRARPAWNWWSASTPLPGSLVLLLAPVGLLGLQTLVPWLRQCQSHCFLCWSYVVSVLELWVNHEKILTFLCRLMQLFPWRPSKMAKVLSCH